MLLPANKNTKVASSVAILLFLILFGLGTYLTSYLKGEISSSIFTVSQSLAYGNKIVVLDFLLVAMVLLLYLSLIHI